LLVVKYISQRVAVMYLGKIVEISDTNNLFTNPVHPYTRALLSAIPNPELKSRRQPIILAGDVPSPINPPDGCRFHTRCPFAIDLCLKKEPLLETFRPDHRVACHRKGDMDKLIFDRFGKNRSGQVS
jgi:oligopeptide/dipeptide ABC transporter ATP-binding protein